METKVKVHQKEFELSISEQQIQTRVKELADKLAADFGDKLPIFISVLNGSFMFFADLIRDFRFDCEVEFIKLNSYQGTESSGKIKESLGLSNSLKDRHVILIEDIVDSGLTMSYLVANVKKQNPASVNICTLLYKPKALKHELKELNYVGFEIENDFVVGYGLDYDTLGRNLKSIYKAI